MHTNPSVRKLYGLVVETFNCVDTDMLVISVCKGASKRRDDCRY